MPMPSAGPPGGQRKSVGGTMPAMSASDKQQMMADHGVPPMRAPAAAPPMGRPPAPPGGVWTKMIICYLYLFFIV